MCLFRTLRLLQSCLGCNIIICSNSSVCLLKEKGYKGLDLRRSLIKYYNLFMEGSAKDLKDNYVNKFSYRKKVRLKFIIRIGTKS
jgi:hypothetical protein